MSGPPFQPTSSQVPPPADAESSPSMRGAPFRAVLGRELRAAGHSRQIRVFAALALAAGLAAVSFNEFAGSAPFFFLQVALHAVSLFSVLAGVGAALAEPEEWPFLFAQPGARRALVPGKFLAVAAAFAVSLPFLFAPALFRGSSPAVLGGLYLQTLLLAATGAAAGLVAGFYSRDRVRGFFAAVVLWIAAVFLYDFAALATASWSPAREWPDLWIALLMLNPLDAFRIQALFSLEQIPPESAGDRPLARWWVTHATAWFAVVSLMWTALLLAFAARRAGRMEI
ncbi:MAG: hypothetical protein WD342_14465 [Verrucomicrobiales bacterium]